MSSNSILRGSRQESFGPITQHAPKSSLLLLLIQLSIASVIGTYIRLFSTLLFTFLAPPILPVAIPQIIGTFILGLIHSHSHLSLDSAYVIIAVGLCGSITSFSATILAIYLEFSGIGGRGAFWNVLAGFEAFGIYGLAVCAFVVGHAVSPSSDKVSKVFFCLERVPIGISASTLISLGILLIVLAITVPSSITYTLAGLSSPFGTLIRYALKPLNISLPFGTLSANLIGVLILSLLIFGSFHDMSPKSCDALNALIGGFCGCLTTLSSIVLETFDLASSGKRHAKRTAAVYILVSFLSGLAIIFLVIGISVLIGGFNYTSGCNVLSQYKSL